MEIIKSTNFKMLSQTNVNELYEMFGHLIKILNKYNFEWSVTGGTLLGTIRNKGLILYDDDIDICINTKDVGKLFTHMNEFTDNRYKISHIKFGPASLIKFKSEKQGGSWIDIFLVEDETEDGTYISQYKNGKWKYVKDGYKPFKKSLFGDLEVNIPNKSKEYLDTWYPEWDKYVVIQNHHNNKGLIKNKYPITDELIKPYLPTE